MPDTFVWADDAGTVRVAWDGRDGFVAYAVEDMSIVEEFTAEGAYDPPTARQLAERWYWQRLRPLRP
jgi:hypothetical protein